LSFATPYSDFVSAPVSLTQASNISTAATTATTAHTEVKSLAFEYLSFASPESDFTAPSAAEISEARVMASYVDKHYSFSTPFADFCHVSNQCPDFESPPPEPMHISYASPYSDFVAAPMPKAVAQDKSSTIQCPYSFAAPESDFSSAETLYPKVPLRTQYHPLPIDLVKILSSHEPIVVTEAISPFRITHVNAAWEGLCGYSSKEAIGNTLEILQGPNTSAKELRSLGAKIKTLSQPTDSSSVILANYTKSGKLFKNRLTVSPLLNDKGAVSHLVGKLQNIGMR